MGERGGKFARSRQERREGSRAPRQLQPGDLPASRLGPQVPQQPPLPQPGGFLSRPPPRGYARGCFTIDSQRVGASVRRCSAPPASTLRPHRPCSPSHLSGAPFRSHGGLCHPQPSPGDRPEAPRGAPPRQLSWGGSSGRGRGPSQVTGPAAPGGGRELRSRTKGSGDPRDCSGGGVQRVGPGEAASRGCAPQRRKPGTAPRPPFASAPGLGPPLLP